jgi:hypothetical protein
VCVEPTFAVHGLTAERIASSLELSPKQERLMFENRRQFSLVVLYEEDESTELSGAVAKALWDMEFRKEVKLKRAPVLMNGGFKRWKEDVGDGGIVGSSSSSTAAGNLRTRGSSVSLKSTGSGSMSGHDGGLVSRQVTGQKLSPTSTANGLAIPLAPKTATSSPPASAAPAVNGTSLPSEPRQLSPARSERDRHPSSLQPQAVPSSSFTSPQFQPVYPDSFQSSIRYEAPTSVRPPVPQIPAVGPSSLSSQFWVPPFSSREEEALRLSKRSSSSSQLTSAPLSSFDQVS